MCYFLKIMKITKLKDHTLRQTLFQIERIAKRYKTDLIPFQDWNVYRIFNFLAKKVKFVKDPDKAEFIQRPKYLLKTMQGDCDCKTTFFLSWMMLKGYPCGYALTSDSHNKPYHHIFPFIYEGQKIIDLDATYPQNKVGESKRWIKRQNFFIK